VDDEPAIALFVKEGGRRLDWPMVDEVVRLYYRLQASRISAAISAPS
jgi:hypothetical protein